MPHDEESPAALCQVTLSAALFPCRTDTEPPTVYVESYTGALYLEKRNVIDRYDRAFASIWAATLDERHSIDLVEQAATELRKNERH